MSGDIEKHLEFLRGKLGEAEARAQAAAREVDVLRDAIRIIAGPADGAGVKAAGGSTAPAKPSGSNHPPQPAPGKSPGRQPTLLDVIETSLRRHGPATAAEILAFLKRGGRELQSKDTLYATLSIGKKAGRLSKNERDLWMAVAAAGAPPAKAAP